MEAFLNIAILFAVGLLSLALCIIAVRTLDRWIFPEVPFQASLNNGNVAVAIFLGALVLGIFLLMGRATAAPTDRYDGDFRKWARYHFGYAYDWQIFKAQGMTESGLKPGVCSHVGACGLMQFMPGTAAAMGLQNRYNARESIRAGIRYVLRLWRTESVNGRLALAFVAYNAGPGNLRRFQRRARSAGDDPASFDGLTPHLWKEPRDYVQRIRRWCKRFGGSKCSLG